MLSLTAPEAAYMSSVREGKNDALPKKGSQPDSTSSRRMPSAAQRGCNQAARPHFMNNALIKEGAGFGSLCQSLVSVSKEWLQAKDILRTAVAAMHTANTRLQESATELVSRGAGSALGDLTHNASSSHPKDDEIDNGIILKCATDRDNDEMVMKSLCGLETDDY